MLSNNNLTSIEDDALGRLEMLAILYLDGNQLTQIPSSLPSSLIKLYMSSNRITDIHPDDLINQISLEVLDLSGNRIIYMPQLPLPNLITLDVRSCGLENVQRQLLKSSPNLCHLLIDGNLIKCSELMEIEPCNEDPKPLTNEYINDFIDYNPDDVERKERHSNSISHFPNDGGWRRCRWRRHAALPAEKGAPTPLEVVPNCWNSLAEQKLITSFNLTNGSTSTTSATAASVDNKFQRESTHDDATKGRNDENLSNETMRRNDNATDEQPHNQQSSADDDDGAMKNAKKPAKLTKLASSVNVVKTEIRTLNNNGDKTLSPGSFDAHRQSGLSTMKTKQIKSAGAGSSLIAKIANPGSTSASSTANPSNYGASANPTETIINRNLIDYVNGDYSRTQSSSKTVGRTKAIKDNESSTNNSKSIGGVLARTSKDNKSRNGSVNGPPLASESMPEGNIGNESGIDATDHQQHTAINQSMNGEQSARWNDIRSESISHPGLLIVITVSVGLLFTFVVVYVYRCNFINSARRRRRRGSCETINEGRDVLNDNFNEETRSFTIETHNHESSSLTASPPTVNHCDLLPMDVLNSTLGDSADRSHISMHLW